MKTTNLALLASVATSVVLAAPGRNWEQSHRGRRCVVPSTYKSSGGTEDDSPTISRILAECAANSIIVFEEGVDYNLFQPISATNLSNVQISMQGNLHLPQDIAAVQKIVADGTSTWITLEGSRVDWVGADDINYGWINSYGQAWWDANPAGSTGTKNRPHLMKFNSNQAVMKNFRSRKPIAWGVSLGGEDILVSHAIVDAYSTGGFPFNTDGFDVQGTNIEISDSVIYNGDDSIAVQAGSHDIVFQRNTIGYQTHGMSIGSLGKNPNEFVNVSNIRFEDVTVISGLYAARFKSWSGGNGLAKDIMWKNIRVFNVTFPIFVTQSYFDQGSESSRGDVNYNDSVVMENFTWADFTGTINTFQPGDGSCASNPCWYNVGLPDLKHTEAIIIECNTNTSCHNFVTQNIEIIPESMQSSTVICMKAEKQLNPILGFNCTNGTYTPYASSHTY